MSRLESLFHDELRDHYRKGMPCLFERDGLGWQHLCHIEAQSKANYKLCKRAFGYGELNDWPLINVVPGSAQANAKYMKEIAHVPEGVCRAAKFALCKWLDGRGAMTRQGHLLLRRFLEITGGVVEPSVKNVLDLQYEYQFYLREAAVGRIQ